ncbi:MAG: TonB-dependent receptor [Pseudomonadota bacterium]|nr:TonB-dependent receptor [Pseudomonadota bacterium]
MKIQPMAALVLLAAPPMLRAAELPATALEDAVSPYPIVVTPSRMRQSLQDVPASVTIITQEMMRRHAITSIPEAMRLVPGMEVNQVTGAYWQINYHGTNSNNARRMNVLIDGMSVYRPALAEVDWAQLPVAIDDIDRIEVTRGPDSVAYGPNSMMAVVNIITRHPGDAQRFSVSGARGSNGLYRAFASAAGKLGNTSLRLSVSADGTDGYDTVNGLSGVKTDATPVNHDSTNSRHAFFQANSVFDGMSSLAIEAAAVEGHEQTPFASIYENFPDRQLHNYYATATYTAAPSQSEELKLRASFSRHETKQEWQTNFPQAAYLPELFNLYLVNPAYTQSTLARLLAGELPSGGTPAEQLLAYRVAQSIALLGPAALSPLPGIADANINESRADYELQNTYTFSNQLRVLGGAGVRLERATSQTYFGGTVSDTLYRLFGNVEYRPRTDALINLGAYVEHDRLAGTTIAPRLAANLQLAPNQTVRVVISKGERAPDLAEQLGNFTQTLHTTAAGPEGSTRFYQSAKSPGGLKSEQEVSGEIGYLLNVPTWGMLFDAKIFDDQLRSLISQTVVAGFQPSNDNNVQLVGFEIQANANLSPATAVFLNFSELLNTNASTPLEQEQYSKHSGSFGLSHRLDHGWQASTAYYFGSGNGVYQNRYGRLDVAMTKAYEFASSRWQAQLRVSHLGNTENHYLVLPIGSAPGSSRYGNRFQVVAELRVDL